MTWVSTKETYVGEWKDNKMSGKGRFTYPPKLNAQASQSSLISNSVTAPVGDLRNYHEGYYKYGKFHGPGELHFHSGRVEKGTWEKDQREGHFTREWKSGHKNAGRQKKLYYQKGKLVDDPE
jgi:1-phosphatidylinositol-4-phosphate 5-kinase